MFSDAFKNALIGCSIAFSSATLTNEVEAATPQNPPDNIATETVSPQDLPELSVVSFANKKLSGPLSECKMPIYDGPIRSTDGEYPKTGLMAAGAAVAGAVAGASIFRLGNWKNNQDKNSAGFIGALIGAAWVGCGSYAVISTAQEPSSISFSTRVSEVVDEDIAHFAHHGGGSYSTSHNLYDQLIYIPEIPAPIVARQHQAPFIPGQSVDVTVYLDQDGHIEGCSTQPGTRTN